MKSASSLIKRKQPSESARPSQPKRKQVRWTAADDKKLKRILKNGSYNPDQGGEVYDNEKHRYFQDKGLTRQTFNRHYKDLLAEDRKFKILSIIAVIAFSYRFVIIESTWSDDEDEVATTEKQTEENDIDSIESSFEVDHNDIFTFDSYPAKVWSYQKTPHDQEWIEVRVCLPRRVLLKPPRIDITGKHLIVEYTWPDKFWKVDELFEDELAAGIDRTHPMIANFEKSIIETQGGLRYREVAPTCTLTIDLQQEADQAEDAMILGKIKSDWILRVSVKSAKRIPTSVAKVVEIDEDA